MSAARLQLAALERGILAGATRAYETRAGVRGLLICHPTGRGLDGELILTIHEDGTRNHALRVAVLVTLEHGKTAGGHVKCWERFAEAATQMPQQLDLTIHLLGDQERILPLADNVRFHHHRPMLGTRSLSVLKQGAGHTDLAPFHLGLNTALAQSDIVHATDFFSFGRTGLRHARRNGKGIVASIHTDTPQFTRVYAGDIIRRMTGKRLGNWLVDGLHLPGRIADRMAAGIDRRLSACHHVLVSKPEDHRRLSGQFGSLHLSYLRRGIDRQRFTPAHRDRDWLQTAYGIPATRTVLMFAGRVDASKSVMVMAQTARQLLDEGRDVHAVIVGKGEEAARVRALLGDRVTMPGNVDQAELARFYASSDLFLFPSTTEVCPNVVIEAKASALPVVVAAAHGGAQFIRQPGIDGLIAADQQPSTWAAAVRPLLNDQAERQAMSAAALDWAQHVWPSWSDVLSNDLLQAWHQAAKVARNTALPTPRPMATGSIGWNETGIR